VASVCPLIEWTEVMHSVLLYIALSDWPLARYLFWLSGTGLLATLEGIGVTASHCAGEAPHLGSGRES